MQTQRLGTALAAVFVALGGLLAATAEEAPTPPSISPAQATFDRLTRLTGTWKGWSTKGWEETMELRLIADGSVLLETSRFVDDPEGRHAMASTYQMDGDTLLLTHYCEAKNAPRLAATRFENGGKKVLFAFRDGVNLPTRDRGHMDSMILELIDDNRFQSRWTWYQNGKETWMEDIRYERVR